jgi:acyl carrier protein
MTIEQQVLELIADQLGKGITDLAKDTDFKDLGADSLDVVEIALAIEDKFNFEIPDEEANDIVTIQDIINLVEKCTNA